MKNVSLFVKSIYFLLFPVLLAYPNKLFEGLYINYIYIIVCFGLMIFNGNIIKLNKISIFWGILFLIVLFANIISYFSSSGISLLDYMSSTLRFLSYFVLVLVLFNTTKSKNDIFFWFKSFLFGFLISLLIIIFDSNRVLVIEPIFKMENFESKGTLDIYFRAYGAYLSPISAGVFLMNVIILLNTTVLYVRFNIITKISIYFIVLMSVICLFTTASRTAIIGMLVYSFLIILRSKKRIKIILFILLGFVTIYYSGILDSYFENLMLRNERDAQISENLLVGSGRFDTFFNSIKLYFDWRTFLFGVGPTEYSKGDGSFSLAHNGFMSLLFCYGLVGFAFFVRVLLNVYSKIHRNFFLKNLFVYYVIINSITFVSSDGPVTHFWILNFICFMYFVYFVYVIQYINVMQVLKRKSVYK